MLLISSNLFAQAPDTLWTRTYGGSALDHAHCVQQTIDGGYIVAGSSRSFGNGNSDAYVVKTNTNGDTIWTRRYGGDDCDGAQSIQQTLDGGYIIGIQTLSFAPTERIYLVKIDSQGDTLWTKLYNYQYVSSVQETSDSGYVITGHADPSSFDVLLIKTDAYGDTLWTKMYGGTADDQANAIYQTLDGGYIVTGYTQSFGAGNSDVYLIKTDMNGDTIWTQTYGGTSSESGYSVIQDSEGGYIIAASTTSFGGGSGDAYLIKTDSLGDTIWTKAYGGTDSDLTYSVKETIDGNYVFAGQTFSFGAGHTDVWLIKVNEYGDTVWTKTFGGSNADIGECVAQTIDGGYIIAGGTYSFGDGDGDFYLIKTEPDVGIEETITTHKRKQQIRCSQIRSWAIQKSMEPKMK